jgi:hypothetical protein
MGREQMNCHLGVGTRDIAQTTQLPSRPLKETMPVVHYDNCARLPRWPLKIATLAETATWPVTHAFFLTHPWGRWKSCLWRPSLQRPASPTPRGHASRQPEQAAAGSGPPKTPTLLAQPPHPDILAPFIRISRSTAAASILQFLPSGLHMAQVSNALLHVAWKPHLASHGARQ